MRGHCSGRCAGSPVPSVGAQVRPLSSWVRFAQRRLTARSGTRRPTSAARAAPGREREAGGRCTARAGLTRALALVSTHISGLACWRGDRLASFPGSARAAVLLVVSRMSASKAHSRKREAPPPTIVQLHAAKVHEAWPVADAILQEARARWETARIHASRMPTDWQQAKQTGLRALQACSNEWIAHRSVHARRWGCAREGGARCRSTNVSSAMSLLSFPHQRRPGHRRQGTRALRRRIRARSARSIDGWHPASAGIRARLQRASHPPECRPSSRCALGRGAHPDHARCDAEDGQLREWERMGTMVGLYRVWLERMRCDRR